MRGKRVRRLRLCNPRRSRTFNGISMPADGGIGGKGRNWGGKRPGAGRRPLSGESYESARRRKEIALANLREYEAKRRGGELLDAAAAERVWRNFLRELRNALLAI